MAATMQHAPTCGLSLSPIRLTFQATPVNPVCCAPPADGLLLSLKIFGRRLRRNVILQMKSSITTSRLGKSNRALMCLATCVQLNFPSACHILGLPKSLESLGQECRRSGKGGFQPPLSSTALAVISKRALVHEDY